MIFALTSYPCLATSHVRLNWILYSELPQSPPLLSEFNLFTTALLPCHYCIDHIFDPWAQCPSLLPIDSSLRVRVLLPTAGCMSLRAPLFNHNITLYHIHHATHLFAHWLNDRLSGLTMTSRQTIWKVCVADSLSTDIRRLTLGVIENHLLSEAAANLAYVGWQNFRPRDDTQADAIEGMCRGHSHRRNMAARGPPAASLVTPTPLRSQPLTQRLNQPVKLRITAEEKSPLNNLSTSQDQLYSGLEWATEVGMVTNTQRRGGGSLKL